MSLFTSTQPSLRARILPKFPARVLAGTGITITRSNGTYTFALSSTISDVVVNKGTVSGAVGFLVSAGRKQRATLGGVSTFSFSGWPSSGNYGEVEIQLQNGGAFAITWPTILWFKGDGTSNTAFASMGVTLNALGPNFVRVWSTDGGITVYGRAF